MNKLNNNAKYWAIAGVLISWLFFWMFLLSPFGFIIWFGILVFLIVKKSLLKRYILLSAWVLVPTLSFISGTFDYFTGKAILKSVGGPNTYHYIDKDTRVESESSGCIVLGYEFFVFPANNLAVKTCTNLFGYQKGSYSGIFPSKDEAKKLIYKADTIKITHHKNYFEFVLNNKNIRLNTNIPYSDRINLKAVDKVIGVNVKNECFVFKPIDKSNTSQSSIYLLDIKDKRLIMKYNDCSTGHQ